VCVLEHGTLSHSHSITLAFYIYTEPLQTARNRGLEPFRSNFLLIRGVLMRMTFAVVVV